MQLPQKQTKLRKLIDAMPKDRKVSKAEAASLMESVGYDIKLVDRTLTYLQNQGYFMRAGSHYGLTDAVLKNFRPKEELPAPADTFKPLNEAYKAAMRRALRLEDGREPMSFRSMLSS